MRQSEWFAKPAVHGDFDRIVGDDLNFTADGRVVFAFRKRRISAQLQGTLRSVFAGLEQQEPPSTSRRQAAGAVDLLEIKKVRPKAVALERVTATSARVVLADGRVLKQVVCNPVPSFVFGWTTGRFDGAPKLSANAVRYPERHDATCNLAAELDGVLAEVFPHARSAMRPTHPLGRSVFSSVAVNVNYESRYHIDRGDHRDGYSALTVVEDGDYSGGLLVFPEYRIAVDVRGGDVLLCQSHRDVHGNTAVTGAGRRVSFVVFLKDRLSTPPPRSAPGTPSRKDG